MKNNVKILVTGGTVFVSRFIAEYYVAKGHEVYVLNRNNRPQSDGVKLIQADRHDLGEVLCPYHFDAVIDVNLKGTFHTIKTASRQMMKQRYGRIVNLSSVSGVMGNAGQANYSSSKAGVIGLTKSVARELASRGITSNAVAPGFIATDMTAAMPETVLETASKQIPLGYIGKPEDIAAAVSFLASEQAGYITGQVLCVDGGMAI